MGIFFFSSRIKRLSYIIKNNFWMKSPIKLKFWHNKNNTVNCLWTNFQRVTMKFQTVTDDQKQRSLPLILRLVSLIYINDKHLRYTIILWKIITKSRIKVYALGEYAPNIRIQRSQNGWMTFKVRTCLFALKPSEIR